MRHMTLTAPGDTRTDWPPRVCNRCGREISGSNVKNERSHAAVAEGRASAGTCRHCHNAREKTRMHRTKVNAEFRQLDDDPRRVIRLTNPVLVPKWREPLSDAQGETPMAITSGNGKNAPWNLYKVKPDAREVWDRFQFALDETRTPCHNDPEAYTEYDDPRYADDRRENSMPTPVEAALLCRECPLAALCAEFAAAEKPDWGVYAGKVYVGGKVQK